MGIMSITVVKKAFDAGLAGKDSCVSATMAYEQGGKVQRLRFTMADGSVIEATASPQDELALVARERAIQHAATKG
jgi:hypothetical protein